MLGLMMHRPLLISSVYPRTSGASPDYTSVLLRRHISMVPPITIATIAVNVRPAKACSIFLRHEVEPYRLFMSISHQLVEHHLGEIVAQTAPKNCQADDTSGHGSERFELHSLS